MVKNKNNKTFIILIIVLVGLSIVGVIIGTTYAYFTAQITNQATIKSGTASTLKIKYVDTNILNIVNAKPIYDSQKETKASIKEFSVKNDGSIGSNLNSTYKVYLNISEISSSLKSDYFKYTLEKNNSAIETGTFKNFNIGDNELTSQIQNLNINDTDIYKLRIWISYSETVDQTDMLNTNLKAKVKIVSYQKQES